MTIADRIKEARIGANMTQQDLALAVSKTRGAVSQWEAGDIVPRRDVLAAIASATSSPVVWLEFGSVEPWADSSAQKLREINEILDQLGQGSPMKYALECLPALIGEADYRDLCSALVGVDIGTGEEARQKLPTGPEFAEMVRSMVIRQHLRRQEMLAQRSQRGLPL